MKRNERIRARRKTLKMTAEELGEKIGRDRATVYRYVLAVCSKKAEIFSPLTVPTSLSGALP